MSSLSMVYSSEKEENIINSGHSDIIKIHHNRSNIKYAYNVRHIISKHTVSGIRPYQSKYTNTWCDYDRKR